MFIYTTVYYCFIFSLLSYPVDITYSTNTGSIAGKYWISTCTFLLLRIKQAANIAERLGTIWAGSPLWGITTAAFLARRAIAGYLFAFD